MSQEALNLYNPYPFSVVKDVTEFTTEEGLTYSITLTKHGELEIEGTKVPLFFVSFTCKEKGSEAQYKQPNVRLPHRRVFATVTLVLKYHLDRTKGIAVFMPYEDDDKMIARLKLFSTWVNNYSSEYTFRPRLPLSVETERKYIRNQSCLGMVLNNEYKRYHDILEAELTKQHDIRVAIEKEDRLTQ